MAGIELKNVNKSYGNLVVYKDFNITFEDGEITAILGESGSGKTTLLNILAKTVPFDGEIVGDPKVSYIFQEDRLVPNLTVAQNLLLINKDINVSEELNKVNLDGIENAYPKSLSAGMARRVSVLRGFIHPSDVLLMDEAFRNLDYSLKYKMLDLLKELLNKDGRTTIFVTHDIDEAVYIADRIVIIKNGVIVYDCKDKKEFNRETILKTLAK